MGFGLLGDWKPIGDGLCEFRIHYGPGYRIYYGNAADKIVLVLAGGDKNSQTSDIELAKALWQEYKQEQRNADN